MTINLSEISKQAKHCKCGNKHYDLNIEKIVINNNAFQEAVTYMNNKSYRHIVIVADETTNDVAGVRLLTMLKDAGIHVTVSLIKSDDQNDVVANEESIVQLLLDVPKRADVLLAVGAGTIHDIARMVSYKMEKPFISIPTAPSVDGFNSMGAPLVIRGVKTTFQTHAPIALFANLNILTKAPKKMIAAGFGDMLGKSTSLADWGFSHLIGDEPFCPLSYQITKEALESCVNNIELIASGDEDGIAILIESLINSGIAMLLVGHSYPASGAEHHLSHYWEMDFIRRKQPQVLHGAKVSISCHLIAELYKTVIKKSISNAHLLNERKDDEIVKKVVEHEKEILEIINSIPEASSLKEMVSTLGGETEPSELGINEELLNNSFKEGHLVRDRFTLLYFYNKYIS